MVPGGPTTYKWCLVALAFLEVLTATGVMFGWSAMSLALQREGVYANLCDAAWLPEAGLALYQDFFFFPLRIFS